MLFNTAADTVIVAPALPFGKAVTPKPAAEMQQQQYINPDRAKVLREQAQLQSLQQ